MTVRTIRAIAPTATPTERPIIVVVLNAGSALSTCGESACKHVLGHLGL